MFRSFTFRVGLLFFVAIATVLVGFRLFSYQQLITSTEEDIRGVVMAHVQEIQRGVERDGPRYAVYLIEALAQQSEDPHLVVSLKRDEELHGNLRNWPEEEADDAAGWHDLNVPMVTRQGLVKAIVYRTDLEGGQKLLVGYDTIRIQQIKRALVGSLIAGIWISVVAALGLTVILLYAVGSYLQRMNNAYRHVMAGDINFRVRTYDSHDVFSRLSQNFNTMMDWVSGLITTLKESTNSLAHDLRTPLARTRLRLQQIEQQFEADDPRRAEIEECIADIDQLNGIFNSILNIAKAEDLSLAKQFKDIDVAEMLADLADYYEAYLEGEEQSIDLKTPFMPLRIKGERQLLTQAIANLISNASKFSPPQSVITLQAQRSPVHKNTIEIIVADTGPGIPEEFREKVKERFFRLDESRNTPGTGLGLNLADAAIRLHSGKLVLEENTDSSTGTGLRAVAQLPESLRVSE